MQAAAEAEAKREEQVAETGDILRSTGDRVETGFWETLQELLFKVPSLLAFGAALLAAWLLGRALRHLLVRHLERRQKNDLGRLLGTAVHWSTVFIVGLFAITILFPKIEPPHILSVLGVGSVAIGLVFKDILQNLLSGIIILVREPYMRGDEIAVGDYEGLVEEVETRATHIRTIDQRLVTIPNALVFSNPVTVNTNLGHRVATCTIGVAYGEDPRRAMEIVLEAVRRAKGVFQDPPPQIAIQTLNDYSIDLLIAYAAASSTIEQIRTRGEVLLEIHDACRANGIELPFPTQVNVLRPYEEEAPVPGRLADLPDEIRQAPNK